MQPAATDLRPAARRWWWVLTVTFVGYLVCAKLGLLLAIPPGIASPFWPAAGLALVSALVWGRWALLGATLGSIAANLGFVAGGGPMGLVDIAITTAIGVGVGVQAWLGAALARRYVPPPLLLAEPAQLWRFLLLTAVLANCTSASIGLAALMSAGRVEIAQAPLHWAAWWVGDTFGVLLFAPVMLTLIGQPREEWAPRRGPVALPLLIVALLLGLGIREVIRLDSDRQRQAFEREAASVTNAVQSRLMQPLQALEAMRSLISESASPDRAAFRRASAPWLQAGSGLQALGWNERVARADIPAFTAREQAGGASGFQVFDRQDAGVADVDTGDSHVIRFIEPLAANAQALGVNTQSVAHARAAIAQAVRSGRPTVSRGFKLIQGGSGVVVYQAVYAGQPDTPDARAAALRGVVFATLRPDALVQGIGSTLLPSLQMCLLDNGAPPPSRVLAGAPGCDTTAPLAWQHDAALNVAGRQWSLRVSAAAPIAPGAGTTWPFALVGLLGAALLGALLLIVTGRTRRIEAAVVARTAELEQRSSELQAEAWQRQRTALALRESQLRLRSILDHAPIGVAYTDTEGRIREANPYLRQLLGTTNDRIRGMPMASLLHSDDRGAEAQARARLLAGEVPMARANLRCAAADGRVIATRASISVLRAGKNNGPRRMVWVIEDITEHLALEEAQRAREGAEASNRAKSEFLSRMSHELRTPLNAVLGFTQLLELDRRQPLAAHQLDWTAQMRQAGWHLLHMINDTLDLSRIESGHIELEPRTLDLVELVDAACALVQQAADKRRIRIESHLGLGARSVIGDVTRVKQILTNLLSNAVKYNVDGGNVIVSSRLADEGRIALDVIDTGAGMNGQQLAQLFQPFNRLGRESGPVEGTGIGLVISLRLAELMGGTLHARSSVGMGSTFTLELPRAAVVPSPRSSEEDDSVGPAAYRRRLIHYVEDNETNAEVMRGILALRPQVELEVSSLGLDGLAAIKRRHPSLVLLDMHLPDIDGLELLRHLQANADTSDIPVVVVSADATEVRISQAIAAGATHYLTKPVNVPTFLAAVDSVLDQLDTHFG
jgi:PAS domain S-box-containing protein